MGRCAAVAVALLWSGLSVAQARIPFKRVGEHLIVVQGTLGGLSRRNLVIDTGAYPSIIDTAVARKLHISGQREELDAVNHRLSRPVVTVPSVELGPIHAQSVRAMTADLSAASEAFGLRIDALIGLDVLERASFLVDYRRREIVFGDFEPLPYSAPFHLSSGPLTVDLGTDSGELRMLVDTGAQSTLLLGSRVKSILASRGSSHEFANLGGNFTLREVTLEGVQLGTSDLGSQAVYVADSSRLPAYPFDGFLSTVQFEKIAFDFERRTFSWSAREQANRLVHLAQRGGKAAALVGALSAGLSDAEPGGLGRVP
jgi:predicted aspartyl protease